MKVQQGQAAGNKDDGGHGQADEAEHAFWTRTIAKGDQHEGDLEEALAILERRGALDAARQDALIWGARARSAMESFAPSELRDLLIAVNDYVIERLS